MLALNFEFWKRMMTSHFQRLTVGGQCWALLFLQLLPVRKYTEPDKDIKDDSIEEDATGCDGNGVGEAKVIYEKRHKDDSHKKI